MPDSPTAALDRAEALLAVGRADDAIAILEPESGLHPASFEIWDWLGRAYGQAGRHVQAERAFRQTVRLRPDLHETHYNLALSLAYQDKLQESIEPFLKAREINPRNPEYRKTLYPVLLTILQDAGQSERGRGQKVPPLKDRPLVSVVVPTHNRPRMLHDALSSVHRQSYRDWEVVVVNDGGEDVSPVLQSLPPEMRARIVQIDLRTIGGPAAARNVAIKASRGDVLAFLDDDDLYSPRHLECLVSGLHASNSAVVYAGVELVEETITGGVRVEVKREPFFPGLRYSRLVLLVRNFIPIICWGVRRECIDKVGVFDETLHYLEDWDLLLRLSGHFDFCQLKDVTTEYRVRKLSGDSISKRHPHKPAVDLLYRRHEARGLALVELARELYLESLA